MNEAQLTATNEAIERLGGLTATAKRYQISVQAVQNWRSRGVPTDRVKELETDTGVPREQLRPDLYA